MNICNIIRVQYENKALYQKSKKKKIKEKIKQQNLLKNNQTFTVMQK